jgi:uncharacterized protein DUF6364
MAKVTLSIDERVVARAKRFAAGRGISVSKLVEQYLDMVSRPPRPPEETPVLARLRGSLAGARVEDHRRHLERKYR